MRARMWRWLNHLRFIQDLIRLRRNQPALRGDNVNAYHVSNGNRVIAFHRWLEAEGQDVIVVATLAEATWYNYSIGFPYPGPWREVFNSDVYDNWVNPIVAGNGGAFRHQALPSMAWLPPASSSRQTVWLSSPVLTFILIIATDFKCCDRPQPLGVASIPLHCRIDFGMADAKCE